jgi:hypothetical protein
MRRLEIDDWLSRDGRAPSDHSFKVDTNCGA